MKKLLTRSSFLLLFAFVQLSVFAQETLKETGHEVKGWFAQNWQWVTGVGVVILVLIAITSGRSKTNRKTTTVVKDDYGNVKSVTSTEVREV
ncbi:MAG: hypothetical protein ABUT20_47010 [Bacteroidota bacterium]